MRYAIALVLVVLVASACAPAALETPQATPTAAQATKVPATAMGGDKTSDAVIVYSRSGGIAGIAEQWTIYADGRVIKDAAVAQRVSAEEVAALLEDVAALGFFALQEAYGRSGVCNDCFTYALMVTLDGRTKRVTTVDAAPDAPAELWKAIDLVGALVAEPAEN